MTGGPLDFARLGGLSIAGADAAPWVTDFLNAACFRRPPEARDPADLRLAFGVLTTYWYRHAAGRRLHVTDLRAFHRAYGARRFSTETTARGLVDRDALLEGAAALLGDWFPAAWADDARRGWGVAFPTPAERDGYEHDRRLRLARLGTVSAPSAPPTDRTWHTYDPVALPSAERALAALAQPHTWPDYGAELGRFTALRPGGLVGQSFEIEVTAGTEAGRPVFQRGYVTCVDVLDDGDPDARDAWVAQIEDGLARAGSEGRAVPEGASALAGVDLVTHAGHFLGAAHSRLVLFRDADGRDGIRDVGEWDPLPFAQAQAYRTAGAAAQHAFWGGGEPRLSMLHQLALA